MYSPGGVLLAGSPSLGSGSTDSAKMGSVLPGLVKQEGYILLAPGAGAGVGIGPVFSAQDLLAPIGPLGREGGRGVFPLLLSFRDSTIAHAQFSRWSTAPNTLPLEQFERSLRSFHVIAPSLFGYLIPFLFRLPSPSSIL